MAHGPEDDQHFPVSDINLLEPITDKKLVGVGSNNKKKVPTSSNFSKNGLDIEFQKNKKLTKLTSDISK